MKQKKVFRFIFRLEEGQIFVYQPYESNFTFRVKKKKCMESRPFNDNFWLDWINEFDFCPEKHEIDFAFLLKNEKKTDLLKLPTDFNYIQGNTFWSLGMIELFVNQIFDNQNFKYEKGLWIKDRDQYFFFRPNSVEENYLKANKTIFDEICDEMLKSEIQDNELRKWCLGIANNDNEKVQNYLGGFYYHKTKEIDEAIYWFKEASKNGNAEAVFNLGVCFNEKQMYFEAINQFRLYIESNSSKIHKAMYYLGEYYANGLGVKQNMKEALQWYKKAAKLGNKKAQEKIKTLE